MIEKLWKFIFTPDAKYLGKNVDFSVFKSGLPAIITSGLRVYHQGYFLRVKESIESTFKKTQELLGDELFERSIADFLMESPPETYSLDRVGEHYPEFFKNWEKLEIEKRKFYFDLAKYEWQKTVLYIDPNDLRSRLLPEEMKNWTPDNWENFYPTMADDIVSLYLNYDPLSCPTSTEGTSARASYYFVLYRHPTQLDVHSIKVSSLAFKVFNLFKSGYAFSDVIDAFVKDDENPEPFIQELVAMIYGWVCYGWLVKND